MGRLGFGAGRFRSRRSAPASASPAADAPPALISPAAAWTGAAGSGFTTIPVNPVRTTAKPALRIITPPNQAFDDELLVGVSAWANDSGSLLTNCGLVKVTAHYEGTSTDILEPSFQTFNDANGVARTYFGWWIRLKRVGDGFARLYFEAEARDATMQKRVIGPFAFLPRSAASTYTHDLTIAPSQAVIAGSRYQTLLAALNYIYNQASADNVRIRIVEAGTYAFAPGVFPKVLGPDKGRILLEATVPVTLANPAWANSAVSTLGLVTFYPRVEPMHIRGNNITIDFSWANSFYLSGSNLSWFDGVNFIISAGGQSLFYKALRGAAGYMVFGNQFFTECTFTGIPHPMMNAKLARGCTMIDCWRDLVNNVDLLIGCTSDGGDNTTYRTPLAAMTVTYGGAGATATIEGSGTATTNRVFTMKVDGATVGTYTIQFALATHATGANYEVAHLVAYINTLAGWTATLLDNSYQGTTLYLGGAALPSASFTATSVKATTLTLYTAFDIHSDLSQTENKENFILADNLVTDAQAQLIFFKGAPVKDGIVVNNALDTDPVMGVFSQFGDLHYHIVVAHNSWSQQGFWFRTDFSGASPAAKYNPDGYCLFANNVLPSLAWITTVDANLVIKDNHLFTGGVAPSGATGTTIGGTIGTLFTDAPNGNFTPLGALLTNMKTSVVKFDRAAAQRGAKEPAGALAG